LEISRDPQTGYSFVNLKVATIPEPFKLAVDLTEARVGVVEGKGRHMGESLQILDNGNLWYSGIEMKIKERTRGMLTMNGWNTRFYCRRPLLQCYWGG